MTSPTTSSDRRVSRRASAQRLAVIGMSTATLSILSQFSIPVPPVPMTLQTFALALTGCVLGPLEGLLSAVVYLLCGAIGLPVFAGFHGGLSSLLGFTGGFLLTFPAMSLFCGCSVRFRKSLRLLPCLAGLSICHLGGILQYAFLARISFIASAAAVSAPYLLKDILSVTAALFLAGRIRPALRRSGLL